VISAPKDAVVTLGSDITINCTVAALAIGDSLAWWHQSERDFRRLFLSHGVEPGDVNLIDTEKYEIQGHYNLVVKSADFGDAGNYVCEISGHGNYTAEVSVLGQFLLFGCCDVIFTHYFAESRSAIIDWLQSFIGYKCESSIIYTIGHLLVTSL